MEPPAPLLHYFAELRDPRIERTKRHSLAEILFIAIAGTIAGADGWRELEAFAIEKSDWLARYLTLPHGTPSDDTFRRVISRLDPLAFETAFRDWMAAAVSHSQGDLIAIDGKTLRGSYDHADSKAALHMVSAWSSANGLVLAQEKVSDHSNEITAIPRVLEILDVHGCIVTIDAMGTQREIAEQIIDQGGDYVLALKQNQPSLYDDVRTFFEEAEARQFCGIAHGFCEQTDGGHGRIEVRRLWCTDDVAWMGPHPKWKGLRSIVMVERCRVEGETESRERRYYITSLAAGAEVLAEAIRGHWGIENRLHWVLDVSFGEDGSRVRKAFAPENLGLLRRVALNLLRQEQSKGSVKGKRKRAGWNDAYLATVLGLR
jgi:predicted transposase YbfD/YdcC